MTLSLLAVASLILLAFASGVGAYRLWRVQRHRYLSPEQVRRRMGLDDADEYDVTGIG